MNIRKDREELIGYVEMLRFGPAHLRKPGRTFQKLRTIGKLLRISI